MPKLKPIAYRRFRRFLKMAKEVMSLVLLALELLRRLLDFLS